MRNPNCKYPCEKHPKQGTHTRSKVPIVSNKICLGPRALARLYKHDNLHKTPAQGRERLGSVGPRPKATRKGDLGNKFQDRYVGPIRGRRYEVSILKPLCYLAKRKSFKISALRLLAVYRRLHGNNETNLLKESRRIQCQSLGG